MSRAESTTAPTRRVETAVGKVEVLIPLLKEYTSKLEEIKEDLRVTVRESEQQSNRKIKGILDEKNADMLNLYLRIESAATDLARYTSQLIEHANLDEIVRIELKLRLGEFEHALTSVVKSPQAR